MTESKDLARVGTYGRSTLTEKQQYALALSQAGDLVPKTFWTKPQPNPNGGGIIAAKPNPGAILYMLETAAMIGVNPMVGLTNIHIIEGKPSLSANLQAALVREAGHRLRVFMSEDGKTAICEIVRNDDPEFTFRVKWGDAEMNAAKLATKDNWVKYQRSMKKARAITECIREACPEVLMGATYSPDELGANTDEQGEPIDLPQINPDGQPYAPAAQAPRPETPIVDTPVEPEVGAEAAAVWLKAIENAENRQQVSDIYQKARQLGALALKIQIGDVERELGQVIIEVGQAFAEAEEAEEDVVEAELDEDETAEEVAVHESEPEA